MFTSERSASMSFYEFRLRVQILKIIYSNIKHIKFQKIYRKQYKNFLKQAETIIRKFYDKDDNLYRWLIGDDCMYTHPVTKNQISINIAPDNIEGCYYFLLFCMEINRNNIINEELPIYVAYLLCNSCQEKIL